MIISLCLVVIAVILTGAGQILLKIGSQNTTGNGRHHIGAYMNISVLAAYGLFFLITIISVIALREIPLKVFYVLASLNYLVVILFSVILLKEPYQRKSVIAVGLIIAGVIVFNL